MNLDPVRLTGSVHLGGQSLPNIVWESAIGDFPAMGLWAAIPGRGQPEGELDSRKSPAGTGRFCISRASVEDFERFRGASTVSFRS